MIFVDTSVWVSFFRATDARAAAALTELLDGDQVALAAPVRIEILSGASRKDLPRLRRLLSALPVYQPRESTWALMDGWIDRAVAAGERFGLGDLLIAAVAAEQSAALWSFDADFERMARLDFLRLYLPAALST